MTHALTGRVRHAVVEAVRTHTGLRVEAALDDGDYPTGVAISKERFAALPLSRHSTHGDWNYTLHPGTGTRRARPRRRAGRPGPATPSHARPAGRPALDRHDHHRARRARRGAGPGPGGPRPAALRQQRGGRARRATGNLRGTPLFDDPDRLLLTLLYQRQVCSMNLLGELLEVTATCIADLVHQTREVLEDHGHQAGFAPVRFATVAELLAFLDHHTPPARTAIIDALSDPVLTGISRDELHRLIGCLAPHQAAHGERLAHRRRGGPRQPGARGGVFPQKISHSERVLLTLLYLRKQASLDALAEALGDVSRSSIGAVVRETRPLLEHHGHHPAPAAVRYRTGAELLGDTPTH